MYELNLIFPRLEVTRCALHHSLPPEIFSYEDASRNIMNIGVVVLTMFALFVIPFGGNVLELKGASW